LPFIEGKKVMLYWNNCVLVQPKGRKRG